MERPNQLLALHITHRVPRARNSVSWRCHVRVGGIIWHIGWIIRRPRRLKYRVLRELLENRRLQRRPKIAHLPATAFMYFSRLRTSVGNQAGRGSTMCPSSFTPPNSSSAAYSASVLTAPSYLVSVNDTFSLLMVSRNLPVSTAGGSPGADALCAPGRGPGTSYQNGVPAFM